MTRPVSIAPHIEAKSGFSRLKCRTALIITPFHIPFTFFNFSEHYSEYWSECIFFLKGIWRMGLL